MGSKDFQDLIQDDTFYRSVDDDSDLNDEITVDLDLEDSAGVQDSNFPDEKRNSVSRMTLNQFSIFDLQ